MRNFKASVGFLLSLAIYFSLAEKSIAQIIPDQTLSQPSLTQTGCRQCVIEGGSVRGTNLFHSFQEFSVETGGRAYFNNALTIENIFARITGTNPSRIDGQLQANGTANLYLLNPNGILFGANARLNLGGSFLATTASEVQFEGGARFNANPSNSSPLLSNQVAVGLGFLRPGTISVEGSGHRQTINSLFNSTVANIRYTGQGQTDLGLVVQPGRTLALIGGDVTLRGGLVTAPSGRIEIGSVQSGKVALEPVRSGWRLNYGNVGDFGVIRLGQQSALDATGDRFSNIHIQGGEIALRDASLIIIDNTGSGRVGDIQLDANQSISAEGISAFNRPDLLPRQQVITRSIVSLNRAGEGANIILNSRRIALNESAYVVATTFGFGRGGQIDVNASQLVDVRKVSGRELTGIGSSFSTTAYGRGIGGDINVTSPHLRVFNAGGISTNTFGAGNAGDINIRSDLTQIDGGLRAFQIGFAVPEASSLYGASLILVPSGINSTSVNQANSGSINVNTQRLTISDGAQMSTTALGSGRAGDVTINASQSISVEGTVRFSAADLAIETTDRVRDVFERFEVAPDAVRLGDPAASRLGSGAGLRNEFITQAVDLSQTPNSKAGSLVLNTPQVSIRDARLTVQNTGLGSAGSLSINAEQIRLSNRGSITATTLAGNGGNIFLTSSQLGLTEGSQITASAGRQGNGGNISINSPIITSLQRSSINANANTGSGGRITISAEGLFQSLDSQITASSNLGSQFDGVVEIQGTRSLSTSDVPLPSATPPNINAACPGRSGGTNQFVVSGTGGMPSSPSEALISVSGWRDPATVSISDKSLSPLTEPVVEAQGWRKNSDGSLSLTNQIIPIAQSQTLSLDCK